MNKPDFEAQSKIIYPTERRQKAFQEGCEHVWNTHVVPLQDQSSITIDRIESENDSYKRRYNQLESEIKALREEIERLKINQPPFR